MVCVCASHEMRSSPASSPAATVNPVTGSRQSGVSDCAETVMTAANAIMAAMAMRAMRGPVRPGFCRCVGWTGFACVMAPGVLLLCLFVSSGENRVLDSG